MSYEPTLLISHEDLEANRELIITFACHPDASDEVKFLEEQLKNPPTSVKGTKIVICTPELTNFNSKVRALLYDFKIDFGTSY